MGEAHFRAKSYKLKNIRQLIILLVLTILVLIFPMKANSTTPVVEAAVIVEEPVELNQDTLITFLADKYRQDEVLARLIIQCESGGNPDAMNKNFNENGQWWSSDYSLWQINNYWHEESAAVLGLDIYNWRESLEYGFVLLKEDGAMKYWSASAWCWNK